MNLETGISINDWAIPLHLFIGKPYTDSKDRWVTEIIITILCFYIVVRWPEEQL